MSEKPKKGPAKKKPNEAKAKPTPEKKSGGSKSAGGLFNANTTAGRANVAKATYAGIFLTYLYFKSRKGKKSKQSVEEPKLTAGNHDHGDHKNSGDHNAVHHHETSHNDSGYDQELIVSHSSNNDELITPSNNDKFMPPSNNDKFIPPSNNDKFIPPPNNDKFIPPPNDDKSKKFSGPIFKRRISPNPKDL